VSAGVDFETLEFTLESIGEFARRSLPDSTLVELDERDEFPEELIRKMCGEELGVQLLFVPEAYGGMGGAAMDVYRVCERMAAGIALPTHVDRVVRYAEADAPGELYAVVRPRGDGTTSDADVVDDRGRVRLRLEGYRTIAVPGALDASVLEPMRQAIGASEDG
jgi:Acyl-CoA dehydrogenase, N-terminal domain/Polyketide synthase dehydratase